MPRKGFAQPEVYESDHKQVVAMAEELELSNLETYHLIVAYVKTRFPEIKALRYSFQTKGKARCQ
jgi:hypothetical protein